MVFKSINPATGKQFVTYKVMPQKHIDGIINNLHRSYLSWSQTDFEYRRKILKKAGEILIKRKNVYAKLMTDEMGKPIVQAVSEIEKCAYICQYFAQQAEEFLAPQIIKTDARKSYITFEPLGVIFAIMPWNFPFWQVFRFLAPMIMSGNVGILKHSPNVTGCALVIEDIIRDTGVKKEIFRTIIADNDAASFVIQHPHIKAVTLTGSTRAGRSVASQAGAVLKKAVLELGGSDPYIILKDADLDKAVTTCVTSRMINSGQSCIAAKRFIVVKSLQKKFEKMFVAQMKAKKMGDPLLDNTDIGPMARFDLRDELHAQVQKSIRQGAKLLCGGYIPLGDGAFYPATVLSDVKKNMLAYSEELFGPVASIIPVRNEKEAIAVANDNQYGLGAAVFSQNYRKAEMIAKKKIEAGSCFVNAFVRSDPRLPFGGIKGSGYGREMSYFGIYEFVNIKTVYVA